MNTPTQKIRRAFAFTLSAIAIGLSPLWSQNPAAWQDPSPHQSGFVTVNGVRLHTLDWSGTGEPLVLIPGTADNPHVFDGIAPQLTDRFRVVGYSRRDNGRSERKGPYDVDTLAEELRSFATFKQWFMERSPNRAATWSPRVEAYAHDFLTEAPDGTLKFETSESGKATLASYWCVFWRES